MIQSSQSGIRMVITDLDGTLHHPETGISRYDTDSLLMLGRAGITRVIATGRNLFSFRRIISEDFPVDYLIYSSGAGIMNWKTGELMYSATLPLSRAVAISAILRNENVDFMVHNAVPDNHLFVYHGNKENNDDFRRRLEMYGDFARPLGDDIPFGEVSQILIIVPPGRSLYRQFVERFPGVKVIRSTSPINGQSMWIEIFNSEVSKGNAVGWLCRQLGVDREQTLACGNDYNDIELLEWAGRAYLLDNAPEELKARFRNAQSVQNSGFSGVIAKYFPDNMQ